jgi:hypothetical protein
MLMMALRIPRWLLPAALCGVVAITSADVVLLRRHPVKELPRTTPEPIGLHVDTDGSSLHVQWNRKSVAVRNAERATLIIVDGANRQAVSLTGPQLDRSIVRYWPESEMVTFRMEVLNGSRHSSDSASIEAPHEGRRHRRPATERLVVEQARPSPFDRVTPEIEVTQARPAPVMTASVPLPAPEAPPQEESRFQRVISKIPLLRHWGKHPAADENGPSR